MHYNGKHKVRMAQPMHFMQCWALVARLSVNCKLKKKMKIEIEPKRYYSPSTGIEPLDIDNCRGITITREGSEIDASYIVPLTQANRKNLTLCSALDVTYLYDYNVALVKEKITHIPHGENPIIIKIAGHDIEIWSYGLFVVYPDEG